MIPDTLMGYPVLLVDNMPMGTVAAMKMGPPLWEEDPALPTEITVFDRQGNVIARGKLDWGCYGLSWNKQASGWTWRAKVEWEELPEEE